MNLLFNIFINCNLFDFCDNEFEYTKIKQEKKNLEFKEIFY